MLSFTLVLLASTLPALAQDRTTEAGEASITGMSSSQSLYYYPRDSKLYQTLTSSAHPTPTLPSTVKLRLFPQIGSNPPSSSPQTPTPSQNGTLSNQASLQIFKSKAPSMAISLTSPLLTAAPTPIVGGPTINAIPLNFLASPPMSSIFQNPCLSVMDLTMVPTVLIMHFMSICRSRSKKPVSTLSFPFLFVLISCQPCSTSEVISRITHSRLRGR